MSTPCRQLRETRERFGLTRQAAGRLLDPSITGQTVRRYEEGGPATALLRELCRAYMREAARLGYEPWDYHESALCPGEFPEPASRDEAALALILNGKPGARAEPSAPPVRSPKSETEEVA